MKSLIKFVKSLFETETHEGGILVTTYDALDDQFYKDANFSIDDKGGLQILGEKLDDESFKIIGFHAAHTWKGVRVV